MVTSSIIWTPKQWKDTLNYEDGRQKGGQKLNKVDRKVDRKFRMTPKMTPKNKEWNSLLLK